MAQNPTQHLRDLLVAQERQHEPWTTGVVNLSESESTLFFKCKNGSSRHLQLGSTNESDIAALIEACQPATFGLGPEHVFDGNHRKAWKMDTGSFSCLFNPGSGRFVAELAQGFCPWDQLDQGIRVETCKLNVYGKGGFFKLHEDTPHGVDMFGSLVIVLPIAHEGGNLLLRHRGRELDFDAPALLKGAPPSSIAYVAFYSDVDHEMLEVSSGYRATITFNLYSDPSRVSPIPTSGNRRKIPDNPFTVAFRQYLRDRAFLSSHRCLGFGFEHTYPKGADEYNGTLTEHLKGPDAFLYWVLAEIGVQPQLGYLYRSEYGSCDFWVMFNHPRKGRHVNEASSDTELEYLLEEPGASIVWAKGKTEAVVEADRTAASHQHPWSISYFGNVSRYRARTLSVSWVTNPSDSLVGRTGWVEPGSEPVREIYYYAVCIVVDLGMLDMSRLA